MPVARLMSEPAVTCSETDSFQVAADKMRERHVGAVIVVNERGRVKTLLTDRDICLAAASAGTPLEALRADSASTSAALTCLAEDSIETAQTMMQASSVRRIVVVDRDDRPVGLLSIDDLAVEALRELERADPDPEIPPEAIVKTLGEIARRVAHGNIPIPEGADALPRPVV
jgi:CBS domain-containing protein